MLPYMAKGVCCPLVLTVQVWVPQGDLRSTRDLKGGSEDLHSLGGLREEGGGLALGEGVQEWQREDDNQERISWSMVKRCRKP